MPTKPDSDNSHHLSARLSKIFIELHDYSFSHRPSAAHEKDPRFVGRKRIREKLKIILMNTVSKSGAYLITGYKGMGKSSFVNQALNDVGIQETRAWHSSPKMWLIGGGFLACWPQIAPHVALFIIALVSFLLLLLYHWGGLDKEDRSKTRSGSRPYCFIQSRCF